MAKQTIQKIDHQQVKESIAELKLQLDKYTAENKQTLCQWIIQQIAYKEQLLKKTHY